MSITPPSNPMLPGFTAHNPLIKSIRDIEITNKTVFMRMDFNVPLSPAAAAGELAHIEDDNRIAEAIPTIKYAIEKGAKVILASHLGRPDGKVKPEFSLEPVALRLAELLGVDVQLADDCVGDGIELMARGLPRGGVLLLENLRFHKEEEANDPEFSRRLAKLADVYITDAFGTAHRKHASTYGMVTLIAHRGMGLLIEKELKYLDPLLHGPAVPFYAVLGGSKVTDKVATIDSLMRRVNGLVIGGAMANAFIAAQGNEIPVGGRVPKPDDVEAARAVLREAKRKEMPVLVPIDSNQGFDIGPRSIKQFVEFLSSAKTVFWNGPLGMFEKEEFAVGTYEVARALADLPCVKIVGGGDTVSAIKKSGVADRFDHLSTGGGAVLEYLEGKGLPGIDILRQPGRGSSPSSNAGMSS